MASIKIMQNKEMRYRMPFLMRLKIFIKELKLSRQIEGFILDIGSGHNPHYSASVCGDKYILNEIERSDREVNLDRPFIVLDAEKLSFRDKVFDYSFASHILEHLDNPDACLRELQRVSKRGHISCPSEFREKLGGFPYHKWYVSVIGSKLVLKQKKKPFLDVSLLIGFSRLWKRKDFRDVFHRNWDLFMLEFEWERRIEFCLKRESEVDKEMFVCAKRDGVTMDSIDDRFGKQRTIKAKLKKCLYVVCFKKKVDFAEILACPVCKGEVRITEDSVKCRQCLRVYPIKNNIPIMLEEAAVQKSSFLKNEN